jgi:hypothetical protein
MPGRSHDLAVPSTHDPPTDGYDLRINVPTP